MTKWKRLTTDKQYKTALARIDNLIDAAETDVVHNELALLSFLVENYENEFHSMPEASPIEVMRFTMEMKHIKQQDLIPVLGSKGNVSKILNGRANLHVADLHPLSVLLGIPVESLIPKAEYPDQAVASDSSFSKNINPEIENVSVAMESQENPYKNKQRKSENKLNK